MKQSIEVEGVELNLDTDTIISMTKRVANIGSLERQSSFTNKLSIPNTSTNRSVAGMTQGNDNSLNKYTRQRGSVRSNGIEVMNNAEIIFESVGDRISLIINADNSVFFDLCNKTKLRAIEMQELDHVWNMQNEFDSIAHVWTDGYIYGLCDTGNQSRTINNLQCQGVIPQVFAKFLFKKIADTFGYTFTGDWWSHPMFDDIVVSIVEARTGPVIQGQVSIEVNKTSTFVFPSGDSYYNQWVLIENYNPLLIDTWGVWNTNAPWKYELKFAGSYEYTISFIGTLSSNLPDYNDRPPLTSGIRGRATRVVNGVLTVLGNVEITSTETGLFAGTFVVPIENSNYIVGSQNSGIFFYLEALQGQGVTIVDIDDEPTFVDYFLYIELDFINIKVTNINAPVTNYNKPISIQDSLPDWTCGNFIKEICNLAGVIPIVDEYNKTIRLMMLNEIAANKLVARDWQSKIDLTKKPEYEFKIDGYARRMKFSYKGEDLYSTLIRCENEQLIQEVDYVKSAFTYSTSITMLGKSFFVSRFNIWDSAKAIIKFDKNVYVNLIERVADHVTYTSYTETNLNAPPGTEFPFMRFATGEGYRLDWFTLYNDFYKNLLSGIIVGLLKVNMDFRLDEFEVGDFDFSIPVYLNNPSGFYYIQELKDFRTKEESTSVEMIRIG